MIHHTRSSMRHLMVVAALGCALIPAAAFGAEPTRTALDRLDVEVLRAPVDPDGDRAGIPRSPGSASPREAPSPSDSRTSSSISAGSRSPLPGAARIAHPRW